MEASKINQIISFWGENVAPEDIESLRQSLANVDDSKAEALQALSLKSPTVTLILAILTCFDRFYLGDIGMGLLKWCTCGGCYIWWIMDIISAKKRTHAKNLEIIQSML